MACGARGERTENTILGNTDISKADKTVGTWPCGKREERVSGSVYVWGGWPSAGAWGHREVSCRGLKSPDVPSHTFHFLSFCSVPGSCPEAFEMPVDLFARAPVTVPTAGWLKATETVSHFWRVEVWNEAVGRATRGLSEGFWGGSFLGPSQLLVVAGSPWHFLAGRCNTSVSVSLHGLLPVSWSLFFFSSFYRDISHIGLRAHSTHLHDLIVTNYICNDPLSK